MGLYFEVKIVLKENKFYLSGRFIRITPLAIRIMLNCKSFEKNRYIIPPPKNNGAYIFLSKNFFIKN